MADEKWFRIIWNDQLWKNTDRVSSGQMEMNDLDVSIPDLSGPEDSGVRGIQNDALDSIAATGERKVPSADVIAVRSTSNDPGLPGKGSSDATESVRLQNLSNVRNSPFPNIVRSLIPRETSLDIADLNHVQSPVSLASIGNGSSRSRSQRQIEQTFGTDPNAVRAGVGLTGLESDDRSVLKQTVRQVVNEQLAELKVYVLESDITDAQQAVKTVVKQASF